MLNFLANYLKVNAIVCRWSTMTSTTTMLTATTSMKTWSEINNWFIYNCSFENRNAPKVRQTITLQYAPFILNYYVFESDINIWFLMKFSVTPTCNSMTLVFCLFIYLQEMHTIGDSGGRQLRKGCSVLRQSRWTTNGWRYVYLMRYKLNAWMCCFTFRF